MLRRVSDLQITRPGIVVPVRPDPTGLAGPTPQQVRGKGWRRTGPGHYVPAETDSTRLEQRIVEAAAGLPGDAAVTGWAALAWCGARWFDGKAQDGLTWLPVPIALDDHPSVASRPGVKLSEDWLFDDDVTTCDGLPVTVPNRAVTFEARRAKTFVAAVRPIDMAAADDLVELDDLASYVVRLAGRQGVRLLRSALDFADENVWSAQEVPMRVAWRFDACKPRPLCNVPIFDRCGRHLFTPDLFDPAAGVAGEYDGALHLQDRPRRRDLNRESAYRDHKIEVVTMMSADRRDTSDFVRRLRAAYRRAAQLGVSGTWTLEQPDWWVDTSTVAARRALEAGERAVWLRRRTS